MIVRPSELRAVGVLALGFGLVGIDRFLISTLFPVIARDMSLGYGAIGTITGALSMSWGLSALVMGNLSDRVGQRAVLVGSLVLFSLLIGASGLAGTLVGLIAARAVMGLADGAFTPASISATLETSSPGCEGRNIGIQQMTLTLFGLGFSPLLVSWLLHFIDWRWVFSIFVLPGLLLAWATWRNIPARSPLTLARSSFDDWRAVLRIRNVRVLMLLMLCWLTCLVTTSAFMPSYLLDHLGLRFAAMGQVMSSIGFGAAAGTLLLPWLSDRIGRKPVMIVSAFGVAVSLILLSRQGAVVPALFSALFMVHFFNNALITLTVGPVCTASVPAALSATASGVVIAVGEFFGGGLAPMIAGKVVERFGIDHLIWLPLIAILAGMMLCVALSSEQDQSTSDTKRVFT